MSEHIDRATEHTTEHRAAEPETESRDRYGAFETAGGGVCVYDRENPQAWIRTDTTLDPANVR